MKSLVVFYSRTDRTRRVARAIALYCGADIAEILDARSRRGLFNGWWRSILEVCNKRETPIIAPEIDVSDYDLVILGSPVWAGSVASPMRTWLDQHRSALGPIAVFLTQGGSGGDMAIAEIAELCHAVPVALLVVSARDLKTGASERSVAEFVESLRHGTHEGSQTPTSVSACGRASTSHAAVRPHHWSVSDHQGQIGW